MEIKISSKTFVYLLHKNDRVRAVFVEEVKILENKPFAQNRDFRRFGGNFDFHVTGPILGRLSPIHLISIAYGHWQAILGVKWENLEGSQNVLVEVKNS